MQRYDEYGKLLDWTEKTPIASERHGNSKAPLNKPKFQHYKTAQVEKLKEERREAESESEKAFNYGQRLIRESKKKEEDEKAKREKVEEEDDGEEVETEPEAVKNEESTEEDNIVKEIEETPDAYITPSDEEEYKIPETLETNPGIVEEVDGRLSLAARDKEIRTFIVRRLAEFCSPEDISKAVAKALNVYIPIQDIKLIKNKLEEDREFKGQSWGVLKRVYRAHREKFTKKLKTIPIANRIVRVQELQNQLEEIRKDRTRIERIPVIDAKTGQQKVNKKTGTLVFKRVTQSTKRDAVTVAAILKQAAQEVGDWTEKIETRTEHSWEEMVAGMRSERGLPQESSEENKD